MSGLRDRARRFGDVMLRFARLDDASMDLAVARLRDDLCRIEAEQASAPPGDPSTERRAHAIRKAHAALRDAERWRP